MQRAVGFDIGGSTLRAGLVEVDGGSYELAAIEKTQLVAGDKAPDCLLESIRASVQRLSGGHPGLPVGLGICAQLADKGETVENSPNLGWRDVPIGPLIRALLPNRQIAILNDLNAIVLGEHAFGAAKGCDDVVAVYPGTGIGGGAIVAGALLEGAQGFAGEIGHIKLGGTVSCGCGGIGCLETIAGGHYIETRVLRDLDSGAAQESDFHATPVRPNVVDTAFAKECTYAVNLWEEVSDALGLACATLVSFLNPEMVLMGGGVLERCPELFALLQHKIRERSAGVCGNGLRIELGTLGWEAGIVGAAVRALDGTREIAAGVV